MCVEKVSKAFYGDYVNDILKWGIGWGGFVSAVWRRLQGQGILCNVEGKLGWCIHSCKVSDLKMSQK